MRTLKPIMMSDVADERSSIDDACNCCCYCVPTACTPRLAASDVAVTALHRRTVGLAQSLHRRAEEW